MECARCLDRPRLRCQIPRQPAGGGSRRAKAVDQSDTRLQDFANSIRDDQRLRSHAHDPQAARPHARTRHHGRSALCEPTLPPRRLIRQLGRGELRFANATEPFIWALPCLRQDFRDTSRLEHCNCACFHRCRACRSCYRRGTRMANALYRQ